MSATHRLIAHLTAACLLSSCGSDEPSAIPDAPTQDVRGLDSPPDPPDNPVALSTALDPRNGLVPVGSDGEPLNLGFEKGTYEDWTVQGDTWGDNPARGAAVDPQRENKTCHDGQYWTGGYESTNSDAGQGTLTSVPFKVSHRFASFLVGGGKTEATAVEIVTVADGAVVHRVSGKNTETMERVTVDLEQVHKTTGEVFIRLVDKSSGGWGHINFDDFRFHTTEPAKLPVRVTQSPVLTHLVANPRPASGDDDGIWVPPGFRVDRLATEPAVTQPIAFAFDDRGRMWIVEAHSYPERRVDGEGKDRIVILADADGDGAFDSRTVFAEGLNLVSGMEVGHGGVWVGAAPELLFIPDRDGDDKPDGKAVAVLDGFGLKDTHETLNSFIWGPDGWLYGLQGVFNHSKIGKPGTADADRVELRAGVFRYHPVDHVFEVFAHGGSNQWGLDFDDHGQLFMTHCRSAWGGGPTTFVVRNGHFWNQANKNYPEFISASGKKRGRDLLDPILRNYLPSSAKYGHGEGGAGKKGSRAIYGGHSHVGTMIYLGDNWPDEYRNQLFTFNLHGHQVNRQINKPSGSAFETLHSGADHAYFSDPRFVGVDLKYGPDGAVYFIDWQDKRHCHNPEIELWDRTDGRVYRMVWAKTYKPVSVDLRSLDDAALVALQRHRNDWQVRTARRLLHERKAAGKLSSTVAPALQEMFEGSSTTSARLRALWALHVVGGLDSSGYARLLRHNDPQVRSFVIGASSDRTSTFSSVAAKLGNLAATEDSAPVRLAIASVLSRMDAEPRWQTIETLARHGEDRDDRFLPSMIWFGLAPLLQGTNEDRSRALSIATSTELTTLRDSVIWFLCRSAEGRDAVLTALTDLPVDRSLLLMAFALRNLGALPPPTGWRALVERLQGDASGRDRLDELGAAFGDAAVLARLRARLVSAAASTKAKRRSLKLLRQVGDDGCRTQLLAALDDKALRPGVIPMIGRFDDAAVAESLLGHLKGLAAGDRATALVTMSGKPVLARALLEAVDTKRVPRSWITALHIRDMRNIDDAEVTRRVAASWGASDASADVKERITAYQKLYSEAPVWAYSKANGQKLFTSLCAICHTLGGENGPDLTGSYRNGVDYFIENIVDPNAVVGEAFELHVISLEDGSKVSGMVRSESADMIEVANAGAVTRIEKSKIADRRTTGESAMPAGLLDSLSERQVLELLKFLTARK